MREGAAAGITRLLANSCAPGEWEELAQLARALPEIVPFFGVHPWESAAHADIGCWLSELERRVIADNGGIGEVGLDRWKEDLPEEVQEAVFRAQLRLADRLRRPLTVHCLRAWDWLLRVLKDEGLPAGGLLLHSFNASPDIMRGLCAAGAYLSVSGAVLAHGRERLRELVRAIPAKNLLIETDAPDMLLPPEAERVTLYDGEGQRINSPLNLPAIYDFVAGLRGVPVGELAAQVWDNMRRFLAPLETERGA